MKQGTFELQLNDFCNGCGEFEPLVEKFATTNLSGKAKNETYIMCEHQEKCLNIMEHLEKRG